MKRILSLIVIACCAVSANAYIFQGIDVDVEAWTGTGENETILVVDWNKIDNGLDTVSESHAFGFRWDGVVYESEMLAAFNDAGILAVTTGYGGAFLSNIGYVDEDDNEVHMHLEEGSWNLASTTDPYAVWGTWGDSEWDFNTAGIDAEPLANGQFEGINAIMWFDVLPVYADDQLDIPVVPEPATITLLCLGTLGLLRKKQ